MFDDLVERVVAGRAGALVELDQVLDELVRQRRWSETNDLLDPLARAAAAGDQVALQGLLSLIDSQRLAHGPIRSILLDESQIDDATQDTLLIVARKVHQFAGRSRFTTWLYTVAQNAARQVLRKERRHDNAGEEPPELDPMVQRLSSVVASRRTLQDAIQALPDDYRIVVELREIDDLSYQEIARQLGIEIGTVRSRLSRGRTLVRELLAPPAGSD